jgi:vancomycin resistance protein YoaR
MITKRPKISVKLNLGKKQKWFLGIMFSATCLLILSLIIYSAVYWGKIYPNTYVLNTNLSGANMQTAESLLTNNIKPPDKITLAHEDKTFDIPTSSFNLQYDYSKTAAYAYSIYHSDNFIKDLSNQLSAAVGYRNIGLVYSLNTEELKKQVLVFAGEIAETPESPRVTLENSEIIVYPGKDGAEIELEKLLNDIQTNIPSNQKFNVHLKTVINSIDENEIVNLRSRAEKLVDKKIIIEFEDETIDIEGAEILNFLSPYNKYGEENIEKYIFEIAGQIERSPQNPVFVFENGVVNEFSPSLTGIKIKKDEVKTNLISSLTNLENTDIEVANISLPTEVSQPEVTLDQVNNLGIKELIGSGTSTYYGSIASRVHNIGVASSKINSTLVPPGNVFSFNDAVGDITSLTGYKQAYIIKDGQTILGDGGGVCQVSTTLFRAALDAGLPIVDRRAHSYRVTYYEQGFGPGIDATVYAPTTDFKFKNDTPGYILIQSIYEPKNSSLQFEIYGTNDGRVATIGKPVITSSSPPPEDLYIDDPNLPAGEIKQIDWAAWGAKVYFDYSVTNDGEEIQNERFYSNFKPWQSKYLRGTAPVN